MSRLDKYSAAFQAYMDVHHRFWKQWNNAVIDRDWDIWQTALNSIVKSPEKKEKRK